MTLCRITARLRHWWRPLLLVPFLAGAVAGCVSPVDTAAVATAGGAYAAAMNRLMLATGRAAVDASSERLLQEDTPAGQTLEQYRRLAAADARRLETPERLRDHNRLVIEPLLSQDAARNPASWTMARRELLLLAVNSGIGKSPGFVRPATIGTAGAACGIRKRHKQV